jgi:predicted TIM-barrel fold metal-dependent hydrolase
VSEAAGPQPIVDVCGSAFDVAGWTSYLSRFATEAPGYLRTFGPSVARRAGIDAEEFDTAVRANPLRAAALLAERGGLATTADEHAALLRSQGVRRQVLQGGSPQCYDVDLNARAAAWAAAHPDVLEAWCGLDLSDPAGSVAELDRCVGRLGMRGAYLTPFYDQVATDDPSCDSVFARAEELRVPVWVHVGMTLAANRSFEVSTWPRIDTIARRHPDLTILVGHGGWPWLLEGMAVLRRHPNVYLDFSAYRPKYVGAPGSGWEPLLHYGVSVVRDQVVFGSVAWIHKVSIRTLAEEVRQLPIGDRAAQAWLHDNAARALGLDAA